MKTDIIKHVKPGICKIYSGVIDIECPPVCGAQNNVFFVRTEDGNFVVKFNYPELATKNMKVANLLAERDIPAPQIHVGRINGQWYETYPHIPGLTLHQAIQNGLSKHVIEQVYNDIMVHFSNMDTISVSSLDDQACKYAHQVAAYNIRNANGGVAAKIFSTIVRLLNRGNPGDIGIYHFDITPKNVLVTPDGRFLAFLDMDGVALCNRNFALGALASKYEMLGMQSHYLYEINDAMSRHSADRNRANKMVRLNQIGKNILWRLGKLRSR